MILTAIVEMPQGTTWKLEHNKEKNCIELDRPLNQSVPHSYGYCPYTLCEDNDPIDCFILTDSPIPPLVHVRIELVGVIKCLDNGKRDDKLIGLVVGDFKGFNDMGTSIIVSYLESYKEGFQVISIEDKEEAIKVYEESVKMYRDDHTHKVHELLGIEY